MWEWQFMNHVERFWAVMGFEAVDRLPRIEWAPWWEVTIERWKQEGLPGELTTWEEINDYFELDPYYTYWVRPCTEDEGDLHYRGLISDMDEYRAAAGKLFPDRGEEIAGLARWQRTQAEGDVVLSVTLDGFFWFPRMLLGNERHLYAFYDQAELLHQANEDLLAYNVSALHAICKVVRPAYVIVAEDMAYNHGPMISRALFEEFMAPYYRRLVDVLNDYGIMCLVDSDGDINAMVPWFRDVGVVGSAPLEHHAGVAAEELRERYPDFRMMGNFDKTVMAQGEAVLRAQFERLLPVMKSGGFIVSVDHQTPPGVSLEDYRCYLRLLWEYSTRGASQVG